MNVPKVGALIVAALVACMGRAHVPAQAQDYPSRTVTMLVPFAPGGGTDSGAPARPEARAAARQTVRGREPPGRRHHVGSRAVAKAAPDGYTLMQATATPMAMNVSLYKSLPYDPTTDLVPVALVARPFVLSSIRRCRCTPCRIWLSSPRKSGQLTYGSGGPGSSHHLNAELFKTMTGTR